MTAWSTTDDQSISHLTMRANNDECVQLTHAARQSNCIPSVPQNLCKKHKSKLQTGVT